MAGASLQQNDDICIKVLEAIEESGNVPNSVGQGMRWIAELHEQINGSKAIAEGGKAKADDVEISNAAKADDDESGNAESQAAEAD